MPLFLVKRERDVELDFNGKYVTDGLIGIKTNVLDCNGEMIHTGDIVKVTKPDGRGSWSNFVCHLNDYKTPNHDRRFNVMGMASYERFDKLVLDGEKIEIVIPHKYLKWKDYFLRYVIVDENNIDFECEYEYEDLSKFL